jgi:hypothetical protein
VAYEYKVVPFVRDLDEGTRRRLGALSPKAAAEQLQSLINSYAADGWEFYSVERKSVRAPAKFLSWLLGSPPSTAWLDLVVMRRETHPDA